MATNTTNLNLIKPGADDLVKIDDINSNMDTLDTEIQALKDKATSVSVEALGSGTIDIAKITVDGVETVIKQKDVDTMTNQALTTDNSERPLLLAATNKDDSNKNVVNGTCRANNIYANASTGVITAPKFKGALEGNADTATKAISVEGTVGSANEARRVWFSWPGTNEPKRAYDDDFKYNPVTKVLTVGSITGSAGSVAWANVTEKPDTYTPATHSHDYLPLAGGTLTGILNLKYVADASPQLQLWNTAGTKLRGTIGTFGDGDVKIKATTSGKSIYLESTGVNISGNLDVTGTIKQNGTAVSLDGHTHPYLPLSGGTLIDSLIISGNGKYLVMKGTIPSETRPSSGTSWLGNWVMRHSDSSVNVCLIDHGVTNTQNYTRYITRCIGTDKSTQLSQATIVEYANTDKTSSIWMNASKVDIGCALNVTGTIKQNGSAVLTAHPATLSSTLPVDTTGEKFPALSFDSYGHTTAVTWKDIGTIGLGTYSKPSTTSAVANTDSISDAIGKLEKALDGKQATHLHPYLSNTTKYAKGIDLSVNDSTYVITAQLKDQDGNNLGTADTIDLPLESVVVNGSYDSTNKKVILTLKSGSTVDFSVADLISGLSSEGHKHAAGDITSGTLPVARGGTGQTSLANVSVGSATNADQLDGWHAHYNSSGTRLDVGRAWGYIPVVKTDGVMEVGKYIDFHTSSNDSTVDYSARLEANANHLVVSGKPLWVNNTIYVQSNTGDYCEGVRINRSTSGWATLMLGCTQNSTAGVASGWCMHRDTGGRFVLSGINSTYSTALFYGTYNSSTSQHTLTIPHHLTTGTIYVTSGVVELTSPATNSGHGGYLDFHYNKSTADYTSRIIEDASGQISVNGVKFSNGKINGYTLSTACAYGVYDRMSINALSALTTWSNNANLVTVNTIAYWDGRYQTTNNASHLTYVKKGTLGDACIKGVDTSVASGTTSTNLPTSAAVASFVEGKGYTTNTGTVKSVNNTSPDTNGNVSITIPSAMGAASASAAGTAGLVPAPAKGAQGKYLRGDGTWQTPTGTLNTCGAGNYSGNLYLVGRDTQTAGVSYSNSYVYMSGGFLTCAGARLTPNYKGDDYATVNLIIQQPNSDTNNTYGLIAGELDGTVLYTYRLGGRYTPSDDSGAVMINARHGVKGSNPVWGREFTVTPWRPSFEGQEIHNGMCYTNSDGYSGFIKFRYANSSDDGNTEAGMTKHIMLAWAWTEISADSQGDIYWPVKWFNEDHYLCWANVYNTGGGYNNYGCGPVWCSARYKDHATFKNDTWGGPVYAFAIGIAYD